MVVGKLAERERSLFMKRRALLVLLVMVMLLCLPGCGGELRAVERCAEQYLHTFRTEGIEKAVEYCHFEATELYSPDDHRTLYVRSGCAIQDYRIQHIDRINDGLYALKLELQDAGGQWKTVYNFVGRINGAYRYINGVSHVPAALRTGCAPEAYRTTDINVIAARGLG